MNATLLDDIIARLTPDEKLELIGKLWASLDTDAMPVSPEVLAELDRRKADYEQNPGSALSLEELLERVQAKIQR